MSFHVAPLRIRLLGGFEVSRGQAWVPASAWKLRSAALLVKLLALAPGYQLHREQIVDILWPDSDYDAALRNLRYSLHTARRTLTAAGMATDDILSRSGESLALGSRHIISTDVAAFEAATASAWQSDRLEDVTTALDLYSGELLPEDRYLDCIDTRRSALQLSYVTLLERLAQLQEAQGNLTAAIAAMQQVVASEPTSEQAHQTLMRLYACSGNQRRARDQYQHLVALLDRELGVAPDAQTREMVSRIEAGALTGAVAAANGSHAPTPQEPARAHAALQHRSTIPNPLSSLIGREREVAEVAMFLTSHRLVTLTGPGGVGKTRIAIDVARDVASRFPDGVFWVDLAPVSAVEFVASTIASAIGLRPNSDDAALDTIVDRLQSAEALLVIDHFEHLIAAAPVVVALLAACPALRVLTTSRVRLHLRGEQRYPVLPLPIPQEHASALEDLLGYPSVQLFAERAGDRSET